MGNNQTSLQHVATIVCRIGKPFFDNGPPRSLENLELEIDKILNEKQDEVKALLANQEQDPSKLLAGEDEEATEVRTALGWSLYYCIPKLVEKFLKLGMRITVFHTDRLSEKMSTPIDELFKSMLFTETKECHPVPELVFFTPENGLRCFKILCELAPQDLEVQLNTAARPKYSGDVECRPLALLAGLTEQSSTKVSLKFINELFVELLANGADPFVFPPDRDGTALYRAASQGNEQMLSEMIALSLQKQEGFVKSVNYFDVNRSTPLTVAACHGHAKCFALLINNNVDVVAGHETQYDAFLNCVEKYQPLSTFRPQLTQEQQEQEDPARLERLREREIEKQKERNQMLVSLCQKMVRDNIQYHPPSGITFRSRTTDKPTKGSFLTDLKIFLSEYFLHENPTKLAEVLSVLQETGMLNRQDQKPSE